MVEMETLSDEEKKVLDCIINNTVTCIDDITKLTELSEEEINQIKDSLKNKGVLKDALVINARNELINKRMCIYHFYKCRGGPEQIAKAAETFSKLAYIEEVHSIVGEYDLLVKFRVKDMDEYNTILNEQIWALIEAAGIVNSMGIVSIHTYVEKANYVSEFKRR